MKMHNVPAEGSPGSSADRAAHSHRAATPTQVLQAESEAGMTDPTLAMRERPNGPSSGPDVPGHESPSVQTSLAAALTRPSIPEPRTKPAPPDFRARLDGKVLLVAGDDARSYADLLSPGKSGMVLSGKTGLRTLAELARANPERLLALDPWQSYIDYATQDRPFILTPHDPDGQDGLVATDVSLASFLNDQIAAGAAFALPPTGVVRAGDTDALKAAVLAMNAIDRDDVVMFALLESAWFNKANRNSVGGILARSKHPVAICLADKYQDPYSKVLGGLREAVARLDYAIVWRVDFAGFDLMARGAKSCSIGVRPSKRAGDIPGEKRFSSDRRNMYPHVLLADMLRWRRSDYMVNEWFARMASPSCACTICHGRKIDRFTVDPASLIEAYRHNVVVLMDLLDSMQSLSGAKAMWTEMVIQAYAEHTSLGAYIGGRVDVPASIKAYNRD